MQLVSNRIHLNKSASEQNEIRTEQSIVPLLEKDALLDVIDGRLVRVSVCTLARVRVCLLWTVFMSVRKRCVCIYDRWLVAAGQW